MKVIIEKIKEFPPNGFSILKESSLKEGFKFLTRLETEWQTGLNTFNDPIEGMYVLRIDNQLIGIGGINKNPFSDHNLKIGRLRRFYIDSAYRRQGFGKTLLGKIVEDAKNHFDYIQLRTDNESAALFYEYYGFKKIGDNPSISHELLLV